MEWLSWIEAVLAGLGGAYGLQLGIRNKQLANYRKDLLYRVILVARDDARWNLPSDWRYDELRRVSYYKMLFCIWRSFDSFYPDKSFAELNDFTEGLSRH